MVDSVAELKRAAALEAVRRVRPGMRLGLGTGSTAAFAVEAIGEGFARGELEGIRCVSTSRATSELALRLGLPIEPLEALGALDLAIDGADEVDPDGNLIKGGGGALLFEKKVERCAAELVIIVDEHKLVSRLGAAFPLPIEVPRELWMEERDAALALGCVPALRQRQGEPFVTDSGNYILDCRFVGGIAAPYELARALDARPGVRAHGLFLDMASEVIVARERGAVETRRYRGG